LYISIPGSVLEVVFWWSKILFQTSDEKLKNWRVSLKMGLPFVLVSENIFLFVVFPFGKLMLQCPLMGIGFNEVEQKINLIGYFKVTIFNSRQ
jgi:hypothetical protein